MALTTFSLGLARKNILDVFKIESAKRDPQWKWLLGNEFSTTQSYETFKQIKGLSPAEQTPEGESAKYDDYAQLFVKNFTPVLFTKALRYSELFDFTNQYKDVIAKQPDFAKAFSDKKNAVAANIYNVGFTDTTLGMNSEVLFSTSHSMGAGAATGSNRPATDIAFGPLAVQQMLQEIRKQKGATGQPMMLTGKVNLIVPPELEGPATAIVRSLQLAGTNNNDVNDFIKNRVELSVCDYFTSATAWFGRMVDNSAHGLFILSQLPYKIDQLAMTDDMMYRWVARESYTVGWKDWHGTWGTVGA